MLNPVMVMVVVDNENTQKVMFSPHIWRRLYPRTGRYQTCKNNNVSNSLPWMCEQQNTTVAPAAGTIQEYFRVPCEVTVLSAHCHSCVEKDLSPSGHQHQCTGRNISGCHQHGGRRTGRLSQRSNRGEADWLHPTTPSMFWWAGLPGHCFDGALISPG